MAFHFFRGGLMRAVAGLSVAFCCVFALVVSRPSAQGQGQAQGAAPGRAGQAPTNLQVLPKDTPRPQVIAMMRTFTSGLGVQCEHCHVGSDPQSMQYAADDKPTKATARKMIQMVMAINTQFLQGVGDPAAPTTPKVTCYTCHRGALKPLTAAPAGGGH
jgi:hypothetical protein